MSTGGDGLRCGCAGATVWFTGPPGSGAATLATALADRLRALHHRVVVLDDDTPYATPPIAPSATGEDRSRHGLRTGLAAEALARNGLITLVAAAAPSARDRAAVRRRHTAGGTPYLEVHLTTPQPGRARRTDEGLYARHWAGWIAGPTARHDPDQAPAEVDLCLEARNQPLGPSVAAVHALLTERGVVRSRRIDRPSAAPI
ncbi:adenylyl-sulfate kinase [Streptomyces sp. NPDC020742]|uniref:adenylyl-sulfate kinase n=1 Tax=Streptomyces sp. NPDC020742 TaxID=3154897 RepID=UPI0034080120